MTAIAQETQTDSTISADPGLFALVALLHCHGIAAEPRPILHRLGNVKVGVTEMLQWSLGAIHAKCTVISLAVVAAIINVGFGLICVSAPELVLSVLERVL
jgi:hypothetical protein